MGFIADQVDNFKAGALLTKKVMRWTATSALKRLLTLSFVGLLATGGYYWYVSSLLSDAKQSSQSVQEKVDLLVESSRYQSAIDWAELCVASREQNLANADWYCQQAMEVYEQRSERTPPTLREEIIDNKAYGAMVVDMSSQLRGVEMDRVYGQTPKEAERLLSKLSSTTGIALVLTSIVLLMVVTALVLVWYAGKQGVRRSASARDENELAQPGR